MSLTNQEQLETKQQLQDSLKLTGLTIRQVAEGLQVDESTIERTLNLQVSHIEDPWVLKSYLEDVVVDKGLTPVEFTALTGDYHDYWFLNSHRIDEQKLG